MRFTIFEEPHLNYVTSHECDTPFQAIEFFDREHKKVTLCKRMYDGSWMIFARDRQTGIDYRYTMECE